MSTIDLQVAKRRLRVIHNADDDDLQQALDGAEQEALRYMNRTQLPTLPQDFPDVPSSEEVPSSEDPVAADVIEGVLLLVKAAFEATTPDEVASYREAAEWKLQPYRVGIGV